MPANLNRAHPSSHAQDAIAAHGGCSQRIAASQLGLDEPAPALAMLIPQLALGDPDAWERFISWQSPLLRRRIRGILHADTFIDDAMQETWIRIFSWARTFRPMGDPAAQAYILRTAAGVACNLRDAERARHLRELGSAEPADANRGPDDATAPLAALQLIGSLAAPQRDILRMRYLDGLSSGQLAQRLGISPLAARLRLHRAVASLRKEWRRSMGAQR